MKNLRCPCCNAVIKNKNSTNCEYCGAYLETDENKECKTKENDESNDKYKKIGEKIGKQVGDVFSIFDGVRGGFKETFSNSIRIDTIDDDDDDDDDDDKYEKIEIIENKVKKRVKKLERPHSFLKNIIIFTFVLPFTVFMIFFIFILINILRNF